ncbi:leucine-rich repeat protein [uncultured Clostridium sp.]|uniref:leucine-rich repeat protein n=1 Tax=uncultured Clostridium sp. TaxID=59620 RepID=UPI0025DEFCF4|nr:leucine-rich repeat protein [uncultured Clostridium sp.]
MIRRNKIIIGTLAAMMSTVYIFSDNLITAKADPYHEMVTYNEIKILDSEMPKEAVDSKGNQWQYYKYEDGTVCLFGLKNPKENVIIPSVLNGMKVTGISRLAILDRNTREVPVIKSVTIPSTVRRIHNSAFLGCVNLENINMPETTTRISLASFSGTKWLENQKYNDGFLIVNKILLDIKDKSGAVTIPSGVLAVGEGVLAYNDEITEVTIPESMIEIRQNAFEGCANLKKAVFKNNLTFVEPNAFSNCSSLTEGEFPIRNKIATYAFSDTPVFNHLVWEQSMVDNISRKPEDSILSTNESIDKIEDSNNGNINNAADTSNMKSGWNIIDGERYYVDSHNKFVTGWKDIDSSRYYFYSNGQMAVNFIKLGNDVVYYLDSSNNNMGKLVTGWKYVNGYWYYFNPQPDGSKEKGYMQRGWLYNNGSWYYFYGDGKMATGFIKLGDDAYYYLDESSTSSIGIMKTGWQKINGYWYYFNKSSDNGIEGMMRKGWQYIDGNWYYFYYGDGKMAANTWIGGYYVNASGAWVK